MDIETEITIIICLIGVVPAVLFGKWLSKFL